MRNWLVAERVAGDSIGLGSSGTAGPSASLGMTNLRAVANLGMGPGGWTEHTTKATNLISLACVLFNAFSKLRVQKAVAPLIWAIIHLTNLAFNLDSSGQ
jgi:hypothetical protein